MSELTTCGKIIALGFLGWVVVFTIAATLYALVFMRDDDDELGG